MSTPTPCIHDYDLNWDVNNPSEPDEILCANVANVVSWVLKHKMRLIMRPKMVNINFTIIPDQYDEDDNVQRVLGFARCGPVPEEGRAPNNVDISVDINQSHLEVTRTAVHEMCHAVQMFEKRLYNSRIGTGKDGIINIWQGRAFSTRKMKYENWPWEVEARKMETEWIREYMAWAEEEARKAREKFEAEQAELERQQAEAEALAARGGVEELEFEA